MTAIRHQSYEIRNLSFQLNLYMLGAQNYITTESYWKKEREVYKAFFDNYRDLLLPTLLSLAVNFRILDDDIKRCSISLQNMTKNYEHRQMAILLPDGKDMSLRDVANKIIHAEKSYWYENNIPHQSHFEEFLGIEDDGMLFVIEGKLGKQKWIAGLNLIIVSEQFYEFSEIACEQCAV